MNSVLNAMQEQANYKLTENSGIALKSTRNAVLDMFALCGAYRTRSEEDCIFMFKKALEEDADLAMKCLFYLADCRGGQGERRFFRVCFKWLAQEHPEIARKNLELIPTYRRWDDVLYSCIDTPLAFDALTFIKKQFVLDTECKTPSLLAKWLPSENASSRETKRLGNIVREYLGMTHKQYRRALSELRSRINIVEKLMSENRWEEIEFDKIPSYAGFIYKNAFAHKDIIAERYKEFLANKDTKVNARVLYPYQCVAQATKYYDRFYKSFVPEEERLAIEKYWNNLPDYFNGKQSNMLCVVDTSGSMTGDKAAAPINIAISLGIYCAERAGGPFKDHYISFSSKPQLIKVEGIDFVDKIWRIYKTNLCDDTNLEAVFDMLLKIADRSDTKEEDIPETIVVISDMEINRMSYWESEEEAITNMQAIRKEWAAHGHKLPRLIYWNVDSRQNTILDSSPEISFVSGMSPSIFECIITGKNGYDLMIEKLVNSGRYDHIQA